jgi:hypothetical protein
MDVRYGLSGLGGDILSPGDTSNGGGSGGTSITPVRIKDIVLNDSHPKFEEVGGWNGLGTIFYMTTSNPVFGEQTTEQKAKPALSNLKQFPLINEIVYVFSLPNPDNQLGGTSEEQYYFNTVNIWNSQHHNALPNGLTLEENQKADYTSSAAGNVRRIEDGSTEINLGSTFVERSNINPLLPFEGDIIHEGRWGNSIRFGSTVTGSVNGWSETGENGDPITILRNGEDPDNNPDGWVPVVEDINKDLSSIWMTSTQQIPIEVASSNYNSYSTPPETPNQYVGTQVILNADRILLNSKTDHIMLSSATSINMNAVDSVNIDTEEHIVDANSILLGNKDATEALMLGNKTIDLMGKMLDEMIAVNTQLSALVSLPPGAPFAPLNAQAIQSQTKLTSYKGQLNSLLSKQNKTI